MSPNARKLLRVQSEYSPLFPLQHTLLSGIPSLFLNQVGVRKRVGQTTGVLQEPGLFGQEGEQAPQPLAGHLASLPHCAPLEKTHARLHGWLPSSPTVASEHRKSWAEPKFETWQ